jgi:hypothetical protein
VDLASNFAAWEVYGVHVDVGIAGHYLGDQITNRLTCQRTNEIRGCDRSFS